MTAPALYLYPLNNTWALKHIDLAHRRIKICRHTNSKNSPSEGNGFFDTMVFSRNHTEVWAENGKIYIKDTKSTNGTSINGERLSGEVQESEPFEFKCDDVVEFHIIIIHKVAARVVCVFSEQEAHVAALGQRARL